MASKAKDKAQHSRNVLLYGDNIAKATAIAKAEGSFATWVNRLVDEYVFPSKNKKKGVK